MSKKIYVTRVIPEAGLKLLREKGYEVDVYFGKQPPTKKELMRSLGKKPYDAVLSLLTDVVDEAFFAGIPTVKIISNYAVGYNNISLDAARARGITITNTPGQFSNAIAEHTVALMLSLTTRMAEADRYVRAGKYKGWEPMLLVGSDLKGKTIGLIGLGNIGREVAKIMNKGFGSHILYYDVVRNENVEKEYGATFSSSIEEVLTQADIVSLHVPLLDSTHHLINEVRLKLMKPTAFLVNTARGPVVDEKVLVEVLKKGVIAGAGLDVYEFEPKLSSGLAKLPNVVLTPHIASARESARNEMSVIAAQNIIDFFEGRVPKGKVV